MYFAILLDFYLTFWQCCGCSRFSYLRECWTLGDSRVALMVDCAQIRLDPVDTETSRTSNSGSLSTTNTKLHDRKKLHPADILAQKLGETKCLHIYPVRLPPQALSSQLLPNLFTSHITLPPSFHLPHLKITHHVFHPRTLFPPPPRRGSKGFRFRTLPLRPRAPT